MSTLMGSLVAKLMEGVEQPPNIRDVSVHTGMDQYLMAYLLPQDSSCHNP